MPEKTTEAKICTEDVLFVVTAAALLCAFAVWRLKSLGIIPQAQLSSCTIYTLTGWYCPGCGGTRALIALLRGDVRASIYWHPAVIYLAGLTGIFMTCQIAHYVSFGRIRGFNFRKIHVYIAAALFALNFFLKNM